MGSKRSLVAYTWGYWGWGTAAAEFVRQANWVDKRRGYAPPIFVDIRIRRQVRAPDFSGDAFEKIIGKTHYRWMRDLGNATVLTPGRSGIQIARPQAAEDLLDVIIEQNLARRRVVVFCACEHAYFHAHEDGSPNCHRFIVAELLLKAARRRGIKLAVVEWPGGDPDIGERTLPRSAVEAREKLSVFLPIADRKARFSPLLGLPWDR